jgi:type I restriction enzyme S subunit
VLEGSTRNGIYKPKAFHGRGTKIVNMGELFAHPRLRAVEMRRVELSDVELSRSDIQPGDLMFARRSLVAEGAGKCSIVLETDEPTTFESSIIRARPDRKQADSLSLYYLFGSPFGAYSLGSILRHVAVAGITGSDLVKLPIPLPPVSEQRAIAHILGTLDDKIELNRRMNETLEEMGRAIFRSWFVDFDPVRAKAEGRDPGLPRHIADLFPDRFEDSKVGEIPAGWKVETIGEVVRVVGGGTPSTKEPAFWEGGTHCWATPRDLSKLQDLILLDTERKVTDAGLMKISSGLLPVGTVLLSSRAPVGHLAVARVPVSVNQGFIAMVCEGPLTNHYVLHWALNNMEQIEGRASGTTFQEISKKNFRPMLTLVPAGGALIAFEEQVSPLYDKITVNLQQTRALVAIRDALLPRLISGELRVPDAEHT